MRKSREFSRVGHKRANTASLFSTKTLECHFHSTVDSATQRPVNIQAKPQPTLTTAPSLSLSLSVRAEWPVFLPFCLPRWRHAVNKVLVVPGNVFESRSEVSGSIRGSHFTFLCDLPRRCYFLTLCHSHVTWRLEEKSREGARRDACRRGCSARPAWPARAAATNMRGLGASTLPVRPTLSIISRLSLYSPARYAFHFK